MNAALSAATIVLGITGLFLTYGLSYMILVKIQATETMWTIWVVSIPVSFAVTGLAIHSRNEEMRKIAREEINKALGRSSVTE